MSFTDYWEELWSAGYPTQAEIQRLVSREARTHSDGERGRLIETWRSRNPQARCRDEMAFLLARLEQEFGRQKA